MLTGTIPSTGEELPAIGCGTYIGFDKSPGGEHDNELSAVLKSMFDAGGSMIDSSPMYGRAEEMTGHLLKKNNTHSKAFLATKVWTAGREEGVAQMERSMNLFGVEKIDLMQIHNLLDWKTQLETLKDSKAQGRIRYIGITHYHSSAYPEMEAIMKTEKIDFLQLNYSILERQAEKSILPLAADLGVAVIANVPFGSGSLIRTLNEKPLPEWASELECETWSELLLKFVISHPAITCAIPGTGNASHMAENMKAGSGPLPDQHSRNWLAEELKFEMTRV